MTLVTQNASRRRTTDPIISFSRGTQPASLVRRPGPLVVRGPDRLAVPCCVRPRPVIYFEPIGRTGCRNEKSRLAVDR